MAFILPKGIVVNSDQIGSNIESIDAEPLDEADIAKVWKVYTTTQRRLLDPTAERLENLWWRIWGSRSKNLKGAIVARLFAQISDGETFVPLRGPPNRLEGSPPLTTGSRLGPGASSTNNIQRGARPPPTSTTSSSVASRATGPIPHPILKKTRGPSSTGPRPTARFVSPHESQDEGDGTSSPSSNSHVTVQPPSPSPESQDSKSDKKTAAVQSKKTFVASKKKRPVILRRQSSQTSQLSPDAAAGAAKVSGSGQSSAVQSSLDRTPSFAEQARGKAQSKFQEKFSPTLRAGGSTQALKSQATKSTDSRQQSKRSARGSANGSSDAALPGDPGPSSRQLRRSENDQVSVDDLTAEELEELELQKMLLEEANARVRKQSQAAQSPLLPESANEGLRIIHSSLKPRSNPPQATMGLLHHDAKGITSAAPTSMDASGQMNLGSVGNHESPSAGPAVRKLDKGKGRDTEELQPAPDMFARRPVQPVLASASPVAAGPLSRSKSQLTLLLEKDREGGDVKKSKKDQSSGKNK